MAHATLRRRRSAPPRLTRRAAALIAVATATTVLAAATAAASPAASGPPLTAPASAPVTASAAKPNFVFVLTDDLEPSLLRYMPTVRSMQTTGTDFSHYVVSDSLCCPSRASIFTGQYPHTTGIFTNTGADGGYQAFQDRGLEKQTFAVSLQAAGYATSFMGKYLNGYDPKAGTGQPGSNVPPGWTDWHVAGNGYPEFGYTLNENGREVAYGKRPADYLTDVLATKGERFIVNQAAAHRPFALEIATFAPHSPYTPAPRDAKKYPGLKAPRSAAFNEGNVTDKAPWLRNRAKLTSKQIAALDTAYRKRAQSVRSVDLMLKRLRETLRVTGQLNNTYVVFSSDNGYHLGEHRLPAGKQTAFTTDVVVPLVVTGPGVRVRKAGVVAQNIDLAPTLVDLAGSAPLAGADGRSLAPVLRGPTPTNWRGYALVEHHGPNTNPSDPDFPGRKGANPPSYEALTNGALTYVEYADGSREYYDNRIDPQQLVNLYSDLGTARRAKLAHKLARLSTCEGRAACQVR